VAASSTHTADVIIVGGGIIGCTVALRLAQAGVRVAVLDRGELGAEASSAAAGMLAPQGELIEPKPFLDLCTASRDLYAGYAQEIEELAGERVGYRDAGSLLVALNEQQVEELAAVQRRWEDPRSPLHPLSGAEVQARIAGLSPDTRAGLFVPGDHWVDNECLMQALVRACQRAGVTIRPRSAATRFVRRSDGLERLEVENAEGKAETWSAQRFILAAGCWSGELVAPLGLTLPLVPCRGQMMEFESDRELPCVVRAGHHYFVPRSSRRILVGTTAEHVGFDKAVTAEGLRSILEEATRLAPGLAAMRFRRAWAGLRPDTADHLPILGHGELSNLIFATGHFRNGILLAPVTGEIIRDLLMKGSSNHPLELYQPNRFSQPKTSV